MPKLRRRIKILLFNLFYRRLWAQIALTLLVIASVPLALLGMVLINTSQRAVRNSVLNNHKEIVVQAAGEISLFMKKPRDLLTNTAAAFKITQPEPWKQESLLVDLAINHPIFMRLSSINLKGREIAGSELGKQAQGYYPEEVFEGIAKKNIYFSTIKISGNHTPYITVAVPVIERGRVEQALVGDVNLRGLWEIVDNIKLGRTGRAFLVSDTGLLITHWDKKRVLRNEKIKEPQDVSSVLSGKTGAFEFQDQQGKKWISSYAPIPDLNWGIVLRQDAEETYAFSRLMQLEVWLIILLSELVVIILSIFMARVLAQPIKVLASRMKGLSTADTLSNRIEIKRHDEVGELIRSFNEMTERLKKAKARERLSAIGEASATIAHELKNSLVSIKSFIQLFPQRHSDERFIETFNKLIPEELKRWERMFKELSDFSSYGEIRIVETDTREIIDHTLKMMEREFINKGIEVECNAYSGKILIMADPERLKQVFMNLIINAIGAMPQGGLLSIFCSLNEDILEQPYLEVRIKDTGIGMPPQLLPKIFEPFHTTKKGAMGLGLAISRRIIEQHRGSICVESEVGAGATFIVRLPVEKNMLVPIPSYRDA